MSITSTMVRTNFKLGDDKRDAGLATPENVIRYDDIAYGPDRKWQILDVYRPKTEAGKRLPVIVNVHGGGWVYGTKETYQFYCMSLAKRGFAVVNFTYRLAPEFKFPASLEDTNTVFSWVLSHAEEYGFDTAHVFAVGDSAGAHILGLYACICTNPAYAAEYDFRVPEGFVPKAIALNCGVYRINLREKGLTANLMKDLLPGKGKPEEIRKIDVLDHITEAFPPVLYMTCSDDFLRSAAPQLGEKLAEKGVPNVFKYYGDEQNKLPHVFHCNIRLPEAAQCNDEECAYFREFC